MGFIGDVSSHNEIDNWTAYVSDTPAVWVKATQASGYAAYASPAYAGQLGGAIAAGGLAGAYHFADPRMDPAADAEHFVATAGSVAFQNGRLLPLLDIENTTDGNGRPIGWPAAGTPQWIRRFIERYRQLTGQRKIMVYASRSFWQTIMQPDQWTDGDVYLMVAAYPGFIDWTKGLNQSGYSHPRLAVWQYTDAAPIAGMANPGDRSRQIAFTQADLTLGGDTDMGPDDIVAPDGLAPDKARNIWGYADYFARLAKDGTEANSVKLDAILTALNAQATAEQQRDAQTLAAVKALSVPSVDVNQLASALVSAGLPDALVQQLLTVLSHAAVNPRPPSA
jgi:GH25 family lysozyme M1 (1,4-beta-N-acetylmuramidase)